MEGSGFTGVHGRSRTGTKSLQQLQYGVYACGGRFTVVVDLVDAEWTRCSPPFVFRISRADAGPRRAGGGGPPGPREYERTADVAGSAEPIDELAGVMTSNESCSWVDREQVGVTGDDRVGAAGRRGPLAVTRCRRPNLASPSRPAGLLLHAWSRRLGSVAPMAMKRSRAARPATSSCASAGGSAAASPPATVC